jgi:GTP cyclohydrolase I
MMALWRLLLCVQFAAWTTGTPRPAPQPQPQHDGLEGSSCPGIVPALGPDATEEERIAAIEAAMRTILVAIGEDPDREGVVKTPSRVAKAMMDNTAGYDHRGTTVETLVNGALFNESHQEMVVVHGIEIFSMCEHHMLPFFGTVDIGYIPNGQVIGLSKLARIADHFARRLQVQERLTQQIAQSLSNATDAAGVMVLVEARHMCMAMRGAKQTHAETVTTSTTGVFADAVGGSTLRQEFLRLVGR